MNEITVQELKEKKENKGSFILLDVREMFEYYISNLDEDILIPLGQLPDRISEISDKKDEEIVVMCRSGSRSAEAAELLREKGFQNVKTLKGGINRWAKEVDEKLPVY